MHRQSCYNHTGKRLQLTQNSSSCTRCEMLAMRVILLPARSSVFRHTCTTVRKQTQNSHKTVISKSWDGHRTNSYGHKTVRRELQESHKGPNPLSDSVAWLGQLLWESSWADQWNQSWNGFTGLRHWFPRSDWLAFWLHVRSLPQVGHQMPIQKASPAQRTGGCLLSNRYTEMRWVASDRQIWGK